MNGENRDLDTARLLDTTEASLGHRGTSGRADLPLLIHRTFGLATKNGWPANPMRWSPCTRQALG
jgi:hypothetical protein